MPVARNAGLPARKSLKASRWRGARGRSAVVRAAVLAVVGPPARRSARPLVAATTAIHSGVLASSRPHNGLGVYLQALPIDLAVDFAVQAEHADFEKVWLSEITFGDAFVPAAAIACRTERIGIATGIVGLWARSPVSTAMSAANLHRLSRGRFVLGVGLQSRTYVANWHGTTYERPLQAVREYLTLMRSLVDGEPTTLEGEIFRVQGFQLMMQPAETRLPLYLAGIAPRMAQLAGELADGILGYFYSEGYLRDVVMPNVRIGAERAGRSLDGFDVAVGFPSVVTRDESGIEKAKGQVVMFATATKSSPAYETSVELAGFEAEMHEIQERVGAGDMAGAIAAVPDEMADALTLSGSADHVRERVAAYRAAGATTVVLNPSAPHAYFPLYEGHFPDGVVPPEFDFPAYLDVIETTIATLGGR
jgi:alkanesulfonate monooxygenase SsuD/methylene tetrahydromethanopterin reductase-like flavin-dependent oxidoreductase (luciferase family)